MPFWDSTGIGASFQIKADRGGRQTDVEVETVIKLIDFTKWVIWKRRKSQKILSNGKREKKKKSFTNCQLRKAFMRALFELSPKNGNLSDINFY